MSVYVKELIHDAKEKPTLGNREGPEILKDGVRSALQQMNRNKSAWYDGIVTEMLSTLDNFSIDKATDIIN